MLFEGAQGSLLDIDHGTYPYVTSSNTTVGGALAGTGVGADAIDYVLGIAKAYATRVGGGPFPTELDDDIGEGIRKRGQEFGATTGRPRRCGWIDLVALKRAVADQRHQRPVHHQARHPRRHADAEDLHRLRIPRQAHRIRAARRRRLGRMQAGVPRVPRLGRESTHGITEWDKLPAAARAYLRALEELSGCPLAMVSTGPDRDANIVLQDPWA